MNNISIIFNYFPFDDEEHPDLSFRFNPDAPIEEQVANIIFRFSEYRKAHADIKQCLSTVSDAHYKSFNAETLLKLKKPVQVLLYARESLQKVDEALAKDIDICNEFLERQEEIYGQGKDKISSDSNPQSDK